MCPGYFGAAGRPRMESGDLMCPVLANTVLAAVGAVLAAAALAAPAPAPSRSAAAGQQADRAQSVGSGPSALVTAGFSCVVLLAAGIGFAYSRRQRSTARR